MSRKVSKTTTVTTTTIEKTSDSITFKTSTLESKSVLTSQTKCSLQEGVRMMVTPSMLLSGQPEATEKAILNPPVPVQKAVVVTQNTSSSSKTLPGLKEMSASIMAASINQIKTIGTVAGAAELEDLKLPTNINKTNGISNSATPERVASPHGKPLGRQKRIIEPSVTPATTPVSQSGITTSSSNEDNTRSKPPNMKSIKSIDKSSFNYGSPDSPMSKMNLMSPPEPSDATDGLITPKSIAQLELPTPERLLPIGQVYGKEGMSALVEKVREALAVPDISHLKQDSLDKTDSTRDDVTPSSRANSPRKLIKQCALESPPSAYFPHHEELHSTIVKSVSQDIRIDSKSEKFRSQRNRLRKVGLFATEPVTNVSDTKVRYAGSFPPPSSTHDDSDDEAHINEFQPSSLRVGDDCIVERCSDCGAMKEEYSDDELGLLIISLSTFIHREPALAAPFLPEILQIVAKYVYLIYSFNFTLKNYSKLSV